MNLDEFKSTIGRDTPPPGLDPFLKALWLEAHGDWDGAHRTVQDLRTPAAAWVHAYLHRKEGDASNAAYWYARSEREMSRVTFDEEWDQIVEELLASSK